jgi:hypothetical protein
MLVAELRTYKEVVLLAMMAFAGSMYGACGGDDTTREPSAGGTVSTDARADTGQGGSSASGGSAQGGSGGTGTQVCVPGSTVECVGPGACRGGQACNAQGTGYGVCDCGAADASNDAPISNSN